MTLNYSIARLENALKRVDFDKVLSPEEQLQDKIFQDDWQKVSAYTLKKLG